MKRTAFGWREPLSASKCFSGQTGHHRAAEELLLSLKAATSPSTGICSARPSGNQPVEGARKGRLGSNGRGGLLSLCLGCQHHQRTRRCTAVFSGDRRVAFQAKPPALFFLFPFIKENVNRFSSAELHGNDFLFFSPRLPPGGSF